MYLQIKTNKHIIEGLLKTYKLTESIVIVEPDVAVWAKKHNLKEDSSLRLAMVAERTNTTVRDLIFKEIIDDSDIPSNVDSLLFKLPNEKLKELRDLRKFFVHLILHEISHCLGIGNGTGNDYKSNQWALIELKKFNDICEMVVVENKKTEAG